MVDAQTVRAKDPRNLELLAGRTALYNQRQGPRVGDFLRLAHGAYVRFTYGWPDSLQTGSAGSGSYHLSAGGYMSFSGALDRGVARTDLLATDERQTGWMWFFDLDRSVANGGVYFEMEHRVFTLREGANTDGIPQVGEWERQERAASAQHVTRYENGMAVRTPIPMLEMHRSDPQHNAFVTLCGDMGLTLEPNYWAAWVQPMTQAQTQTILQVFNRKGTYYNNWESKNTLLL